MTLPKAGPGIVPVTVTDRTCVAVLGVPWRTLRTWLDAKGIRYGHIGRRPVVRVDDVLRALEGDASPAAPRRLSDAEIVALANGRGRR